MSWGVVAAGAVTLVLIAAGQSDEPAAIGNSALDEVFKAEAERAALTDFIRSEPIAVLGLAKGPDNSSSRSDMDLETCQSWKMTEADIAQFFGTGHAMPGEEWHHLYDVYPCAFRGSLQIGNRVFSFTLNMGSFAHIKDLAAEGDGHWFGCELACTHLFPARVRWSDPRDY